MNADVSNRIALLRFPLIVAVVFIHSVTGIARGEPNRLTGGSIVLFVENVLSWSLARVAVPMFFAISGYLFFVRFDWSATSYLLKLQKRFWALLVPCVIWNSVTVALYAFGERVAPAFFSIVEWPPIACFHAGDCINAIFGLGTIRSFAGQFWFVRDLMVLILLVPFLRFALERRLGLLLLGIVGALWFADAWPLLYPNASATAFFLLGAYLSKEGKNVCALDRNGPACLLLFLLAAIGQGFLLFWRIKLGFHPEVPVVPNLQGDDLGNGGWLMSRCVHQFGILCGIPAIWWLAGYVGRSAKGVTHEVIKLGDSSFFLFAAHVLALKVISKVLTTVLAPSSSISLLALYFLEPLVVIPALVLLHQALRSLMPAFEVLVCGNRTRSTFAIM